MEPLRKIFWGFILLFFTFTINNGPAKIVFLPAFVGYLILLANSMKLASFAQSFRKIGTPLIVLSVFSGINFITSLLGIVFTGTEAIASLISIGFYLWMLFLMLNGLHEIANRFELAYEGKQFTSLFPIFAGLHLISIIFFFILPGISLISIIVELVVHIVFLVRLARFSRLDFTLYNQDQPLEAL
ncbi:MAG: hypothetical protein E4G74_00405 [Erysipelotrichales bacterium]|nr:MAG: hypothetical protein E4G74_00405 [Erysipelotrichales bacterium]